MNQRRLRYLVSRSGHSPPPPRYRLKRRVDPDPVPVHGLCLGQQCPCLGRPAVLCPAAADASGGDTESAAEEPAAEAGLPCVPDAAAERDCTEWTGLSAVVAAADHVPAILAAEVAV